MKVDPLLTETVVLYEITRRAELGDPTPFRQYHAVADRLYHRHPDAREAAFQKLHSQFFATLGFSASLQMEFRAFPEIEAQASDILVGLAAASVEEGADLSLGEDNGAGHVTKRVGIRLHPDRFLELPALRRNRQGMHQPIVNLNPA